MPRLTALTAYSLVIWDWNGTLIDDISLALSVVNDMLSRRGLPAMDEAGYREIFDFPISDYYRRAGFDFDREPFPVLADEFISQYSARREECTLHHGVAQVLEALCELGIRQVILSASHTDSVRAAVDAYRIGAYFETVQGLDDHFAASKTDAGKNLISRLALAPREVVMIGDTTHDFDVAQAMGVDAILIASGHQDAARLRRTGAPVFDSLDSLYRDPLAQ